MYINVVYYNYHVNKGGIVSMSNTASIITLALSKSDNNNNNNNNINKRLPIHVCYYM